MIFTWGFGRIFLRDGLLRGLLVEVVFRVFYLLGEVDFGTFFAWGFAGGRFTWGCEAGV